MDSASRAQYLNESVCISHSISTLRYYCPLSVGKMASLTLVWQPIYKKNFEFKLVVDLKKNALCMISSPKTKTRLKDQ